MKIRQGFVSNSSSASFVVRWGYKKDYKHCQGPAKAFLYTGIDPIWQAMNVLMEGTHGPEYIPAKTEDDYYDKVIPAWGDNLILEVAEHTKLIKPTIFESVYITSMRNDIFDYENSLYKLIGAISMRTAIDNEFPLKIFWMKEDQDN